MDFPTLTQVVDDSLESTILVGGRCFTEEDKITGNNVIMINEKYEEILFGKGKGLNKYLEIGDYKYLVVGILSNPITVKNNVQKIKKGKAEEIRIYGMSTALSGNKSLSRISNSAIVRFDEEYIGSMTEVLNDIDLNYTSKYEINQKKDEAIKTSNQIFLIAFVSLGAFSMIIISIVMAFSVKERVSEIGIRRVLGANKDDVLFSFIIESFSYGVLGALVGIFLAVIISIVGFFILYAIDNIYSFAITVESIVIPVCSSMIFSLVAGLIPALVACKMNIVNCLKVE